MFPAFFSKNKTPTGAKSVIFYENAPFSRYFFLCFIAKKAGFTLLFFVFYS